MSTTNPTTATDFQHSTAQPAKISYSHRHMNTHTRKTSYLPDVQVRGCGFAGVLVRALEQLSQANVEGSLDVADGQGIMRPLAAALHVTDNCMHARTQTQTHTQDNEVIN